MSVGKGDDASDGAASDDYDEEEDDDDEYNGAVVAAENGGGVAAKLCASSRVCTRMSTPPFRPPDQAPASSRASQQQAVAAPKETATGMLFAGSFNADSSSAKDHQSRPLRQAGPLVNNYYTSLLTSFPAAAGFSSASPDTAMKQLQSSEQPLREILSDPVSGELMEDATIFPCGHSFGAAGVQKIQETRVCLICQAPTRVDTGSTNFALRVAVQAFRQERGIARPGTTPRPAAKRRKDQDAGNACDENRNKGVQFPYVVHDRVLIKGNKRTPERFVGKEAIITTQCLNGWYLVRTIENGESVRLQYRSLQKIEGSNCFLFGKEFRVLFPKQINQGTGTKNKTSRASTWEHRALKTAKRSALVQLTKVV